MSHRSTRPTRYGWQIVLAVLLVLVVLSLSIPAVRASLSAWLGLSVAPSNQMPATAVTLVAPTPPAAASTVPAVVPEPTQPQASIVPTAVQSATTSQPAVSAGKPAEIIQLSSQAGWDILAPGRLPAGYHYESAYFDINHQMAVLTYTATRALPGATDPSLTETKAITVLQAQKNDFVPLEIALSAQPADVKVNGQPAVYVIGAWDTEFVKDDKDPNGGKIVSTWRNDLQVKNLYFQVAKIFVTIVTDDAAVSQQELVDLAANMN